MRILFVVGFLFADSTQRSVQAQGPLSVPFPPPSERIVATESAELAGQGVVLAARLTNGAACAVRLDVLTDHLVRVRVHPAGTFAPTLQERDWFLNTDWPAAPFTLTGNAEEWIMQTQGLTVGVRRDPFALSFSGADGFDRNAAGRGDGHRSGACFGDLRHATRRAFLRLWRPRAGKGDHHPPDRAAFNHRGQLLQMRGLMSNRIYHVPFFMSSKGYGLFLNTLTASDWDIAKSRNDPL